MTGGAFTHERYVDLVSYQTFRHALRIFLLEAEVPIGQVQKVLRECVTTSVYAEPCVNCLMSCLDTIVYPYEGEPRPDGYHAYYQCPECFRTWNTVHTPDKDTP